MQCDGDDDQLLVVVTQLALQRAFTVSRPLLDLGEPQVLDRQGKRERGEMERVLIDQYSI